MQNSSEFGGKWIHLVLGIGGLTILYFIQRQNFLLFHSLVELASILVSFALFIVVWNAREQLDNAFLAVVGVAYLFVGGLDLLHTLAYSGMGVFPTAGADLPTQLWIFSRYIEAISLVGAGVLGYVSTQKQTLNATKTRPSLSLLVLGYTGVVSLGLASIFVWDVFPQAFVEGEGLTQFKIMSEYVIIGLLLGAVLILYAQRTAFESRVFRYLSVAIVLTIGAEFAFTLYVSVYGLSNAIGHFFKLGSFFLVYLAVVKTGITDPQQTLYRTLANRERDLRQYQQTVGSAIDPLAAVDTEFNYLFANEVYCQYQGIDESEIRGEPLSEVISDEEYLTVKEPLAEALQGEESRLEITRSTPAKGDRIFEVQLFPIFGEGDDIRGVGKSMRDVTEQRESERRLETLISNLPGVVYQCQNERSWPMDMVNGRCREVTGYEADEIVNGNVSWGDDIIHPADRDGVWTQVQQQVSAGESFELTYRILTRSGEVKWVWEQGRQIDFANSGETILEGFITDITERTRLEQDLRDAKERYESLFNSIRDAILVADTDRRIINCNPAFTDLFGYTLEEIRGKPTKYLYESEEEFESLGAAIRRHSANSTISQTVSYEKRSGQIFPGETTVFTLRNAEDEIIGSIGIIQDVSEREDRLSQLTNIDRILRHNFKNEINVINGFARQIETKGTGEVAEYAGRILHAGTRLADTVEKEREITKFLADRPPITEIDISNICRQVTERLSSEYPAADISTEIPDGAQAKGTVHIEKAIRELLTNGIVYSASDEPKVSLVVERSADTVSITVTDDNPPIPEMERDVLLGVAQTPLYHGSGMGLWLVHQIVKYADGVLEFQVNAPAGNVVTISLPTPNRD